MIKSNSINKVWTRALWHVATHGELSAPRGLLIKECLGMSLQFPLTTPLLTVPERKVNHAYMAAEVCWMLSGSNRVEDIQPWAPSYGEKYSDDGETVYGAYGPKLAAQLPYVIQALIDDPSTRQAVISTWIESPKKSKDIPCTTSLQWLIRNGKLHCINTMRSSDLWLGWPNDVFTFAMVSQYIMLYLRRAGVHVELGNLIFNAGSMHLYEKNWEKAKACIQSGLLTPDGSPPAKAPVWNEWMFPTPEDLCVFFSLAKTGQATFIQ